MILVKFAPCTLTLMLVGCGVCGSNEEPAAMGPGKSQQKLAKLVEALDALDRASHSDASSEVVRDFRPYSVRNGPGRAVLHLAGCADDMVLLVVHGLDGKGSKSVELLPGERNRAEVLWKPE